MQKTAPVPPPVNTVSSPRRSTKPPGPSSMFTGRKDALSRLSEYFDEATTSVACATQRVFVLFGMGGSGKTQIALKFVNEFRTR